MNKHVTIIDYGIGNLRSVAMAFEQWGATINLTDSANDILESDRLVLPGVGAFSDGMSRLQKKGLLETINKYNQKDRPFLGICLGMQMLFDSSEEFGITEGLGLIPGSVVRIPETSSNGVPHKIPHIGWNELQFPFDSCDWKNTILNGIKQTTPVYFVHSFTAQPAQKEVRLADAYYNGRLISAAVRHNNCYGCQFHPEKSGKVGLKIIKNFLEIY